MSVPKQASADYRDPRCTLRVEFTAQDAPEQLVAALDEWGFAIAVMREFEEPDAVLKELSTALNLGPPYVPSLYRQEEAKDYSAAYSDIRSDPDDLHPGFSRTTGQDWHVDGLLDDVGVIKTTILWCVRPAHRGGETLIFNSLAAFLRLRAADPEAAEALMAPTALLRRSTLPGVDHSRTGPVFALDENGELVTRYTDNDTCEWDHSAGAHGALRRALSFLAEQSRQAHSRLAVRLGAGEALIFRNDRLSHGREAYVDTARARRHLVRALYTKAPVATDHSTSR
ncbi:TauD/TfdA family dioxygenase [Streptomyces sp. MA25(2023)]|uniref:TauD/TfdA family dioxygenase n=1 Tax=Streptomyces sp. MA25(2023) TaxID=3055078 RepID=UPI0025B0DBE4|nr:TauD/TfdA family dioxygenase [Streptomyces sp. MA25(2023)]MDN3255272.1 TauD/TfdA family dioxygenase [Streptomyces sp. MA25(2023)]